MEFDREDYFKAVFESLKILKNKKVILPKPGEQERYPLTTVDLSENMNMLINRKGHIDKNKLTYIMNSKILGQMIRLDMSGTSHIGFEGEDIPTPHVHIFDEAHNQGKIAVPLSSICNTPLGEELVESLFFFLEYNNVDMDEVKSPLLLIEID